MCRQHAQDWQGGVYTHDGGRLGEAELKGVDLASWRAEIRRDVAEMQLRVQPRGSREAAERDWTHTGFETLEVWY